MNSKIKYILICILTIAMGLAVKFGPVNKNYYQDLELEKYYEKINEEISKIEKQSLVKGITDEQLQEIINDGRVIIENAKSYLMTKEKVKVEEIVPKWSSRLDVIQQEILNHIQEAIDVAKESKSEEDINNARKSIPYNLPNQWKSMYENIINDLSK